MKVRNGFVSNSSSSSFIVAVEKDSKPLHLKINIEDECEVIETIEELEKSQYFKYYDAEDRVESEEYQNCIKAINKGKVIKMFKASSEDYSILSGFHGHRLKASDVVGIVTIIADGNY
jgi:hypothetical protein